MKGPLERIVALTHPTSGKLHLRVAKPRPHSLYGKTYPKAQTDRHPRTR